MATAFCPKCGTPRTGDRFCAKCGNDFGTTTADAQPAPPVAPTATQGLAQAGLDVQRYNLTLLVGRVVGFAVGMAILFFIVGPMLGTEGALGTIVAFFVLGFGGLFVGQWVALLLMRR